jgi:hypothetical protein
VFITYITFTIHTDLSCRLLKLLISRTLVGRKQMMLN